MTRNLSVRNIGGVERILRVSIAIIAVILYMKGVLIDNLGVSAMIAAAVLILTSFISFCPLYAILGVSTNKTK